MKRTQTHRDARMIGFARRVAVTVAAPALAMTALQVVAPSAGATTQVAACIPRTTSTDWKAAVKDAKSALAEAQDHLAHGRYEKATEQIRRMKRRTQVANTAATALIGKPPTDPESDDPPGPTAVLKVGGLDHTITQRLVPLFADTRGRHVVPALTNGLLQADLCRDTMLDTVIALKPGKRDDYVDGLSDTLNTYPAELTAIANELSGSSLTPDGRDALGRAQQVVTETNASMQRVFGGGERSSGRP
jgi:hypothetical protein